MDPEVVFMLHSKIKPDFNDIESLRDDFKRLKERILSICVLCWTIDPANRPTMDFIAAMMR